MVVICIWCALFVTSYSSFEAKFVDIIGIFFYTHSPNFCKNQALYIPLVIKFLQNIKLKGGLTPKPPLAYALASTRCHCIIKAFRRCFMNIYRYGFKSPARNGDLKSMSSVHIVTSILLNDSFFLLKLFLFQ